MRRTLQSNCAKGDVKSRDRRHWPTGRTATLKNVIISIAQTVSVPTLHVPPFLLSHVASSGADAPDGPGNDPVFVSLEAGAPERQEQSVASTKSIFSIEGDSDLSSIDQLLLLLSRESLDESQRRKARSLLASTFTSRAEGLTQPDRGTRLIEAAARHAVLPRLWTHLSAFDDVVPPAVLSQVRSGYLLHFRKSLHVRAACIPILSDFALHGIQALAFKGPVIAAMAYRDPNMRVCTDLDLLIDKRDVPAALDALDAMEFEPRNPLQEDYDDCWSCYLPHHRPHGNANGYVRGRETPNALHIDLHWGFASRYFLFPWRPADVWPHQQTIELSDGMPVPTLSDADTLLFLCMHAAKDSYDRLRLVCDIAGLLRHRPGFDAAHVIRTAVEHGGARMLALGVSLAQTLYDAPVSSPRLQRFCAEHCPAGLMHRAVDLLLTPRRGIAGLMKRCAFHRQIRDHTQDALGTFFYQTELSIRTWLHRLRSSLPTQEAASTDES